MPNNRLNVVTGAYGYTGRYIARRLLASGTRVRTLTDHPDRPDPFGGQVETAPFNFGRPAKLAKSLEGATTLFNTYWIRFEHGAMTFEKAVRNTRALIRAAEEAGVRRIVHTSIANPSADSPFPYYRGKAEIEALIRGSKLSYAILRPTVIFGPEDILINNIAWMLRHFPAFGVPDRGECRLQPVFVEDFADAAVEAAGRTENTVMDVVGPETFAFEELVRLIAKVVRSRARVLRIGPSLALHASRAIGVMVKDIVLTRDELYGLMADLLVSEEPPRGRTRLSEWLKANADSVGREYHSELDRHYR